MKFFRNIFLSVLAIVMILGLSMSVSAQTNLPDQTSKAVSFQNASPVFFLTNVSSGVKIKWNKLSGTQRYIIYRRRSGEGYQRLAMLSGAATEYIDKGVKNNNHTMFQYTVRAYNGTVFSRYTPKRITRLLAPDGLTGKSDVEKVIVLNWNRDAKATGYQLQYKVNDDTKAYTISNNRTTSIKFSNMVEGKIYRIYLRSYRRIGTETYYSEWKAVTIRVKENKWNALLNKYKSNKSVNQLIFVKYTGGTKANVLMYNKVNGVWRCVVNCQGYVGSNGIGKQREGDRKTPTGDFAITGGFGINRNPGTGLSYLQVNQYHYWCGDPSYYNQLVDIRQRPHACSGEHLIDYKPQYYYGMFMDYNKECTYKKGSAIFLHCTGSVPYTAGCVAVSQTNMIKMLQYAKTGTRICIYNA